MISKTKLNERMRKKTNPELVETIKIAKKNNLELAKKLSVPTRSQVSVNLDELNGIKEDNIIVAGKVLGNGEINRKISISALGFSKQAKEKLIKAECEIKTIKEVIEKNPKLNEFKIL